MNLNSGQIGNLLLLFFFFVATSLQQVLRVRFYYNMDGFSWFVGNLVWPVSLFLVSWPFVGLLLLLPRVTGKRDHLFITKEAWRFPKWKIIIFAALAMAINIFQAVASPHLPGPLQVLPPTHQAVLSQLLIPTTMVASAVFFKSKFTWKHSSGAAAVLFGIVLVVLPNIIQSFHRSDDSGTSYGWQFYLFLGIYLVSLIPSTAFWLLAEKWLKEADLNPLFFKAWEAVFMVPLSVVTVPIVFIRLPHESNPTDLDSFFRLMDDSCKCRIAPLIGRSLWTSA